MQASHPGWSVDILMYHSISEAGGPTSIRPATFIAQMQALAASGLAVVSLDDLVAAHRGTCRLPRRAVILTFDDGFQDFADAAWPVIRDHGWQATVFLPTAHVGRSEAWRGQADPPRPLMGWTTIAALAAEGARFGAHTVSHPDLTRLDAAARRAELDHCRSTLADRLGRAPDHFAPPYGLSDTALREGIAARFRSSCGTRLGQAGPGSDLYDLPRIEMFYFTDSARWQAHLAGRGAAYLALRQGLRKARSLVLDPWATA